MQIRAGTQAPAERKKALEIQETKEARIETRIEARAETKTRPSGTYKRELHRNWLIFSQALPPQLSFAMEMLKKNTIRGLLPISLRAVDEELLYAYDITSRIDLRSATTGRLFCAAELLRFFTSLYILYRNLEEYLLDGNGILFDPAYVYLDAEGEAALCYTDFAGTTMQEGFFSLADYLLDHVDPKDVDALVLTCRLRFVLQGDDWAAQMKSLLTEYAEGAQNTQVQAVPDTQVQIAPDAQVQIAPDAQARAKDTMAAVREQFDTQIEIETQSESKQGESKQNFLRRLLSSLAGLRARKQKAREDIFPPVFVAGSEEDWAAVYEETEDYLPIFAEEEEEGESGTCLLAQLPENEQTADAYLIPAGVYDKEAIIRLPRKMLLLGTQMPVVDICLPSPAVSRLHARIYCEGNDYLLADLNSKNGTSVNGEALVGMAGHHLREGDQISFADLSYRFTRMRNGRAS